MKVVVLGADSYVGSHFVKWVSHLSFTEAVGWALNRTAGPDYNGAHVYGLENIESAVSGADIVVNLHEAQDFSLSPDEENLRLHNVQGHHWKLVHLSTSLLQCSSRWPNVNTIETMPDEIPSCRPFNAYCRSKQRAEELLNGSNIDCIILRAVPVYGQGDICSIITDMVKISSKIGFVPRIGDNDGTMQMIAIDNLLGGIWKSIEKLSPSYSDCDEAYESLRCEDSFGSQHSNDRVFEIVSLSDSTENRSFYTNFGKFLERDDRYLLPVNIPFLPLYYLYYFFVLVLQMISVLYNVELMKKLPDPDYLYLYFYHWTFFNNYKAREYLDYSDVCTKEERQLSCEYYRTLPASAISKYSWESTRTC